MNRENKLYIKLWTNVLEKAIQDLYYVPPETVDELTNQNSHITQELYWKSQAQAWFKSKKNDLNSFEGVCLILGIEPSEIRRELYEKGLL
jgi:hypothetical protein